MAITVSNNLKLALRGYKDDGTTAATTVRTQIGSGYRVRIYKVTGDALVASGTAAGSLGGTGVNVTGTVSLSISAAATIGTDAMYARVEKSDGTVWIRGVVGLSTDSAADAKLSASTLVPGASIDATLAFDFPATGGGGGTNPNPNPNPNPDPPPTGNPNYTPRTPPRPVKTSAWNGGWLRKSTDPGFYVPTTFIGLHRDGGPPLQGWSYSAPNFSFGSVRFWDADGPTWSVASQMGRIDRNGTGTRDWTYPDAHKNQSDVTGKHSVWTHGGTGIGLQKYPGEYFPYPYLGSNYSNKYNGGGSPPADNKETEWKAYVTAVIGRYSQIKFFEPQNEPGLSTDGQGDANTYDTTRESSRSAAAGPAGNTWNACFFTGTAEDQVRMNKWTKDALVAAGDTVKLMVGGWVYQDTISDYWGAMRNAVYRYATCEHPTISGLYGKDLADALSFHIYLNKGQTANGCVQTIANYKSLFASVGFPTSLPIYNSEIGYLDGDQNSTNATFVGQQMARAILIHAAMGVSGIYLYKWSQEAWMGWATDYTQVGQEIAKVTGIAGKTVRQGAWLDNDQIWVECEDGSTFIA